MQLRAQESYEGLELTSFSPTRVPLKWLQVGCRYPSSTSLVLNGAKKKKTADDKRRSVSAQSFFRSTRQFSSQHGARSSVFSSLSCCGCLLLVAFSLHFHCDGNYREKEAEIKY